ncbi:MAG: radical SAM family heme chaperone HemW [Candidatus Omnitrophota bacterium]
MKTALYIHIPCCACKCPYCSFAVVSGKSFREEAYLEALRIEADCRGGQDIVSLYVGGGTPSLLSEEGIERLNSLIEGYFSVGHGERVFEMNPESVTPAKAVLLKRLGFNRLSFGAQSFNLPYLSWLGRTHRPEKNFHAFDVLRAAGFDNINVDLMFGFPGQTLKELCADIDALVSLGSEHVAVYALTVEERSVFHVQGVCVSAEAQAELYQCACERLNAAGFRQYEVSNFARPGLESRHNIHYWQGGDYVGLGMGAHSHFDGERSWNADTLPRYLAMIRSAGRAVAGQERLEPQARMMETLVFGLRMNAGVNIAGLEKRFDVVLAQDRRDEISRLIEGGFLIGNEMNIRATGRGRLVLDEIAARLI